MKTDWTPPTELPDLRRADLIAIDSETKDDRLRVDMGSGWPFRAGHVCGISVAFHAESEVRGLYFPLRHPDTNNFDPDQVYRWLRDHVAAGTRFVTQNGLYDWGWLRAETGIKMPPGERLDEIGALSTVVAENRFRYSLGSLCAWRGLPGKDETLLQEGIAALGLVTGKRKKIIPQNYIWQLPARYVGPYAEADAVNTLLLYESLNPILDQEGTRAAYRLEVDILPMVLEMRLRGIRIDLDAAERARALLLRKRDAALAELSEKLGSPVSMHEIQGRKWLEETFDRQGIQYPRTEKGNPSFTAGKTGWMAGHGHWLPPLVATANKYDKAVGDFVQKLIDYTVNGRIHAEINPHRSEDNGTKSFRFSYSDPPLQQMPSRDKELAPLIRGIFLPEEGEIWAKPDASQQEFRLVVHYANQHGLRKAAEALARYRDDADTDFHALAATITGLERNDAKAVNFAKIYGAGVKKFAQMIGKPLAEAQQIYERYDRELPFLHQLSKIYSNRARAQGYITLYDGARRHFDRFSPGGKWTKGAGPCSLEEAQERVKDPNHPWHGQKQLHRADIHTALNALIQGSAARHTKLWMRACWREGIVPLLQMHDCLDTSVRSHEQAELVARLGEEAIKLDVPMRVDLKFGRSWGDATHKWQDLQPAEPAPAKKTIWANRDHDIPVNPTTEPPQQGTDGRLYQRVIYDGRETFVPQDELREPAEPASTAPDMLADILETVPESIDLASTGSGSAPDSFNECAKCQPMPFVVFPDKVTAPRETALGLAVQGVHVFPAPPNTKKSYKSAAFNNDVNWGMTRDPQQVRRDFRRWPDAGVGLPTGKVNGIFVVEADKKDVDGVANLDRLREQYGDFPSTPTAISPSGSPHYYFRHPGDDTCIQNSRSKLAPGVDVRGDGGMVIAPPTVRKDGQYRWVSGLISEPPAWLLEQVVANYEAAPTFEAPALGDGFDEFTTEPEPIEKLEAALAVLDPRELGHDEHLKVACVLFRELGDVDGFNTLADWLQSVPDYYDPALAKAQWRSVAAKSGYGYGAGSLYYLADTADHSWRETFTEAPDVRLVADAGAHEDSCDQTKASAAAEPPKGNGAGGAPLLSVPSEPAWPVLAPEAYHGLAGDVVAHILPNTESDPVALLLQYLVSFGNAIGRQPYYLIEQTKHYTNLFTVLVGQTSKSRKGTSARRIRAVFNIAEPDWARSRILSGMSSGEGLVYAVRDPVYGMRKGVEELIDAGVSDKRLFLEEREFFQALTVLKREGNTLSRVVRDAWDCVELLGNLTKHSPTCATDPMISIVGHITAEELRQTLDHTAMANGYANRFLFACVKRSKLLPHGGAEDDAITNTLGTRTLQALTTARSTLRITMTEAAKQHWTDLYVRLAEGSPGLLGAITDRAEAQTIRLALIYALLDRASHIDVVHLDAASAVWDFCADSARHIFGDVVGDPTADTILRALRNAGTAGLARTDLFNLFGRHLSVGKIDAALTSLLNIGKARRGSVKGKTRPTEMWFAV